MAMMSRPIMFKVTASFFKDRTDESNYLVWLREHETDGYVANRWPDGTVILHHAHCGTLTANPSYCKVTPQYSKLCADNLSELLEVAKAKKVWNSEKIRECGRCWNGKKALLRQHPVAMRSIKG